MLQRNTSNVKPQIPRDPGDQGNDMRGIILLLQTGMSKAGLRLLWDPGDQRNGTKNQWNLLELERTT